MWSEVMQRWDLKTRRHSVEIFPRLNFPFCRLFAGAESDVALCRHADPVMNRSALHYDALFVPTSARLNARRLCIILSFGQLKLIIRLPAPQRAQRSLFLWYYGDTNYSRILFCCVTVPSFGSCVWLIELQLQLNYDSPHTLILWNFKAACVSLNPKSLWNDAKKYRCGISCRLAPTNLDCGLFCQLTPLHSLQKHLKSISYW